MADLKFQMTPGALGAGLTFRLLRGEEESLSATEDFADRDACLAAIREAAEALDDEQGFSLRSVAGGQVLELSAPDGRALARSNPLSAEAAATLQEALAGAASEQEEYQIDLPPTTTTRTQAVPAFLSAPHVISAADYDFDWPSSSGLAGFESFQNTRDGRYYFHFNDAHGAALLYSRGFSDVSQRNKRLRAVIASGVAEQRYERREEGGRHFFILKGRNGQEIARSRAFLTFAEMEAAVAWMRLEMPRQAEQQASQTKARKSGGRGGGSRFNLGLASLAGIAGFELLRAADRRHYFLFNGDDGHPLLFSQGYKTGAGRDQGVRSLIRLGANPARYETAQEDGQFYSVIRAGNRQEIARSPVFATEAAATAAMGLLQTRIPTWAAAFGVPEEILETSAGERLMIRVPRAEAPEDAAALPAALLAGAAVGAAALGLSEAASAQPIETAPAAPPVEALETPVVAAPAAPASPALAPPPALPAAGGVPRPRAGGLARRFWPVPVAALALACLAWGLSGHLSRKPEGVPSGPAIPSSTLVSATPASQAVPAPVPQETAGAVVKQGHQAGTPSSLMAGGLAEHVARLQRGAGQEHPSVPPVTVRLDAYREHRVSHPRSHPAHHPKRGGGWPDLVTLARHYRGGS